VVTAVATMVLASIFFRGTPLLVQLMIIYYGLLNTNILRWEDMRASERPHETALVNWAGDNRDRTSGSEPRFLKHQRLNRMREARDLRSVPGQPEEVRDFLIGRVHHHHRDLPIGIHERRREQRASAR